MNDNFKRKDHFEDEYEWDDDDWEDVLIINPMRIVIVFLIIIIIGYYTFF